MKKFTPIIGLLLSLLVMLPAAYYLLLSFQQQVAREESRRLILEQLAGNELILLQIPLSLENTPNSLFKRIHDREFLYKGMMYDIVEKQIIGHETWYLVYPDIKESGIKKQLDLILDDQNNKQKKTTPARLFQQTFNLFLSRCNNTSALLSGQKYSYPFFAFQINRQPQPDPPFHPPKS